MKLETKIRNLIAKTNATNETRFDVVAHELWGNAQDGFDTNTSWYIANNADIETVLESARGRWEVFKLNYLPKARVGDIQDIGYDDNLSSGLAKIAEEVSSLAKADGRTAYTRLTRQSGDCLVIYSIPNDEEGAK